jgi:hypothetical protein
MAKSKGKSARANANIAKIFKSMPKGTLHKALGVSMDKRLPRGGLSKLASKGSKRLAQRAKLVLAIHFGAKNRKKGKK